uniref:ARAD1B03410p n=1 Tax=Blastobotrys adeninivorans TaxID=409370 RepID=A0A060TAU0_BLAAD
MPACLPLHSMALFFEPPLPRYSKKRIMVKALRNPREAWGLRKKHKRALSRSHILDYNAITLRRIPYQVMLDLPFYMKQATKAAASAHRFSRKLRLSSRLLLLRRCHRRLCFSLEW